MGLRGDPGLTVASQENTLRRLRDIVPVFAMTAFAIMGATGLLMLRDTDRNSRFLMANCLMHIQVVLEWLILTFRNT